MFIYIVLCTAFHRNERLPHRASQLRTPICSAQTQQRSCTPHHLMTNLQILPKELQHRLVAPFIFLLDPLILQVASRPHPPMDLVLEGLNIFLALQVRLEFLHVRLRFVLRRKQDERDFDRCSFGRIDHGGVAFSGCFEDCLGGGGDDGDDFAAPAELLYYVSVWITWYFWTHLRRLCPKS